MAELEKAALWNATSGSAIAAAASLLQKEAVPSVSRVGTACPNHSCRLADASSLHWCWWDSADSLLYSIPVHTYLDYFHTGIVGNNPAVNILVHTPFCWEWTWDWNCWVIGFHVLRISTHCQELHSQLGRLSVSLFNIDFSACSLSCSAPGVLNKVWFSFAFP